MSTIENNRKPRLLVLGAHPDDAEYHAGGLATIYRLLGRDVKLISVTDGSMGHHERSPLELIGLRRQEAAYAGSVIGANYETWEFPDGRLEPTLDVRHRIVREIRQFQPDLILTHRTCDYHPDHRAVAQCVQDAAYMVTVPHIVPEVAPLHRCPVIAYMCDLFTRPVRLKADVLLDVTDFHETIARMMACHKTQVFEWLAFEEGILDTVPDSEDERLQWVKRWYARHAGQRTQFFREEIMAKWGKVGKNVVKLIEAFEISEYAIQPDDHSRAQLFPDNISFDLNYPNACFASALDKS